jgi:catechol 2,3-dioxygenase-like lactoylglutathione lyase family enzyme
MPRILAICTLSIASLGQGVFTASAQTRPKISGIAFVRVAVGDPQAAASFYHGTLQLPSLSCCCYGQNANCYFVNASQQIDIVKMDVAPHESRIDAIGLFTTDAGALRKYLLSRGLKPQELVTDSHRSISFLMKDPEGHKLEFIQLQGFAGSVGGPLPFATRIIHAGFVVKDRAAMDKFYKDILGFRLYWHGGMTENETDWVDMQVPDGTEWIEYMLNIPADAGRHTLGVMNHVALGTTDVKAAAKIMEAKDAKLPEGPKIGRDGKWQLNLYDPDDTRLELMEFTPTEKPCCAEYTGPHPKP